MDNQITFRIGSAFSGEGFTKAQTAVKGMQAEVSKAASGSNALRSALGTLDAQAQGATKAVTGLINAFASLSLTTGLIQGGMIAINKLVSVMNDRITRSSELLKEFSAASHDAFMKTLSVGAADAQNRIVALAADLANITKVANGFNAALAGLNAADAKGSIINLEIEKFNAVVAQMTDEGKANVEAEYNVKIALQKKENAINEAKASVDAVREQYDRQTAALAEMENAQADAQAKLEAAQTNLEAVAIAHQESDEAYVAAQKELTAAKQAVTAADAKVSELQSGQTETLLKLQTAEQNLANTTAAADLEVQKANAALQETTKIWSDAAIDVDAFAEECRKQMEAAEKLNLVDAEDELKKATDEAAKTRARVKEAEANYQQALDAYRANINNNLLTQAVKDGTLGQVGAAKDRQAKAAAEAVRKGIADGSIRNSADQHRAEMAAARAQRDLESSRGAKQEQRDQQRADRINKMGEKSRSEADKKFLDDFNNRQAEKNKAADDLAKAQIAKDEAEMAAQEQAENIKKLTTTVEEIKDKLGLS